jgi:hypothetical protein
MSKYLVIAILVVLLVIPVTLAQDEPVEEVEVQFVELDGPAAEPDSELSGLVWVGDYLLLVAENPNLYITEDYADQFETEEGVSGFFFGLEKADILAYLEADDPEPLTPFPVPVISDDIVESIPGFDGFEAAGVFDDGEGGFVVVMVIEADTEDESMLGFAVPGRIDPELSSVELLLDLAVPIEPQTEFNNMSYESIITIAGETISESKAVTLYEANGAAVNEAPTGQVIDLYSGELLSPMPFVNVEFRITDATALDEDGIFWATNYFYVGEDFLAAEDEPLFAEYGMGASQAEFDGYERLVAFQYTEEGITLADMAPIQLGRSSDRPRWRLGAHICPRTSPRRTSTAYWPSCRRSKAEATTFSASINR